MAYATDLLEQSAKLVFDIDFGYGGNHHMEDYDYLWPQLTQDILDQYKHPDVLDNIEW